MEDDRSRSPAKYRTVLSVEGMSKRTHFSQDEVRALQSLYQELTQEGKMDRLRFREMIHTCFDITDDVMLDRIFRAFDANNDALVDEQEWMMGLSVFVRGSLEEHINFAYFCYDINGDRSLAREELYHCLKNCLIRTSGIEEDVEESIKEIVEIALRKLDTDKNGQITFPDFQAAVIADPLLLEACGPCLPTTKAVASFFINLRNNHQQLPGTTGSRGLGPTTSAKNSTANRRRQMRRSSSFNPLLD